MSDFRDPGELVKAGEVRLELVDQLLRVITSSFVHCGLTSTEALGVSTSLMTTVIHDVVRHEPESFDLIRSGLKSFAEEVKVLSLCRTREELLAYIAARSSNEEFKHGAAPKAG